MLESAGPLTTVDDRAYAALAIGELLDEDLDLDGDPTYAVTQSVDVEQEGTIDPPDDRPCPRHHVPRPPSVGMRQEEAERTQLGRLADVDAVYLEQAAEEDDPRAGAAADRSRLPADHRRSRTCGSSSTTSGTTSASATCRRGAGWSSGASRATTGRSSVTSAAATAC